MTTFLPGFPTVTEACDRHIAAGDLTIHLVNQEIGSIHLYIPDQKGTCSMWVAQHQSYAHFASCQSNLQKYFWVGIILGLILLGTIWLLFQLSQGQCQKLWLLKMAREPYESNVKLIFQAASPSQNSLNSFTLTDMDFDHEMTIHLVLVLHCLSNTWNITWSNTSQSPCILPVTDGLFSWEQLKAKTQSEDSKPACNESSCSNKRKTSLQSHSQGIGLTMKRDQENYFMAS